jgi:hypothetical protein
VRRGLVAAFVAALVVGSAAPSPAASCAGRTSEREGASGVWATYELPRFSVGPAQPVAHAGDADRWYVTNGIAIVGSKNGGCTWDEVLVLPEQPSADLPANRQTDRIRSLSAAGGGVAAAVEVLSEVGVTDVLPPEMRPPLARVTATLVLWGNGRGLERAAPLTLPLGRPGPLVVAPSDGKVVYATAGGRLHRTADGGDTWTLASVPPSTGEGVTEVAVHPKAPSEVYAVQDSVVHRSTDGGVTTAAVLDTDGSVVPGVAVTADENNPRQVWVLEQVDDTSSPHQVQISTDGTTYGPRRTGAAGLGDVTGTVQSSASGPRLDQFVFTTQEPGGADVFSYDLSLDQLVPVDDFRLGPLLDADVSGSSYLFRSTTSLVRWLPGAMLGTARRSIQVGPIGTPLPPLSPETVLSGPQALSLGRDERATVPLELDLSPEPTPIDVFFLLDTSGSMDDVVNGLANGFAQVARDLRARRIDAQFGLGEYQDTAGTRYRRLLDISEPGEPLRRALQGISTAGGAEPAWTGLHQMSTGTGIRNPASGDTVPAGQGASWRQGSLRVVVHATDEVPSADAEGATKDQAVRALRDDGVLHVGLEVLRNRSLDTNAILADPQAQLDANRLHRELSSVSRATGALAPEGGVDCDGDGTTDVASRQPLVCQVVPTGAADERTVELVGPLLAVLSTLHDEQPVGIDVSPPAAAGDLRATVRSTSATTVVDVKQAALLSYELSVTCAPQAYGGTYDLSLRPEVGLRTGSPLPLRVSCAGLPAAARLPVVAPPPAQPKPVAVALPPPPVPPPAPANAPAPAQAPAPAALPAGVSAVNPVVGLGLSPEEQEAQLVMAEQQARRESDELAMSAVDQRPDVLALRVLPLLLVTGAAAVLARRRREELQPREQRSS